MDESRDMSEPLPSLMSPTHDSFPFSSPSTPQTIVSSDDHADIAPSNADCLVIGARGSRAVSLIEQHQFLSQVQDIFRTREVCSGTEGEDYDVVFENPDFGFQNGRWYIESLLTVRSLLDQMWESDSGFLVNAAELLANVCRNEAWRKPFGEAGILDFFLAVIADESVHGNLMLHSLRLIGNCCVDVDENRERVVSCGSTVHMIPQCSNPALVHIAVPVLYNICVNYSPAQQQVGVNGICEVLLEVLQRGTIHDSSILDYTFRLMDLVISQPQGIEHSPDDVVETLIRLTHPPEQPLNQFIAVSNLVVTYLQNDQFQKTLVARRAVEMPLGLLVRSYSPQIEGEAIAMPTDDDDASGGPAQLEQMRTALTTVMSEISAIHDFPMVYSLDSPLVASVRVWIATEQTQLQLCACYILGNFARSDQACKAFVQKHRIHRPLASIAQKSNNKQLLYAALSFIKNLSIPSVNKAAIGSTGLIENMSKFWSIDTIPQIQCVAAGLTRQLVNGCYDNVLRLLSPLSRDPDSPAHDKTYLSLLLSLFRKTDDPAIKTEIARTISAVCRCLYSSKTVIDQASRDETARRLFTLHKDIVFPIHVMIMQDQFPVVRSEGWFTLALMARSEEGSLLVSKSTQVLEIFQCLARTVTFDATVETDNEDELTRDIRAKDRENALVMLSEMLQRQGNNMAPLRKQTLKSLLEGVNLDVTQEELIFRAQLLETGAPKEEEGGYEDVVVRQVLADAW